MKKLSKNSSENEIRESLISFPPSARLRPLLPISKSNIEVDFPRPLFANAREINCEIRRVSNGPTRASGAPYFKITNAADQESAQVMIYDQIGKSYWLDEGTGAKEFRQQFIAIPNSKKIDLRINSNGGNVFEGIAIYNTIKERSADVTCYIDGAALSIASVIALAASKVVMPKTAQLMIHDPSTYAEGTEAEMQKAINALRSCREAILAAYVEKTGKDKESLAAAMLAETWYQGESAKEMGFADEVTDAAPITNSFDLSNFRNVPGEFRKLQNSAVKTGGQENTTMDKKKIVALLKKHGATVDDNATIEQLEAQLETVLAAKATTTQPAPPSPAPAASATENAAIALMQAQMKEIKDQCDNERRINISNRVDVLIQNRQVLASERDFLIENGMKDERHLTNAAARPQVLPPEGISVECVSEAPSDISNHVENFNKDVTRHLKNSSPERAAESARSKSLFLTQNREKLVKIWNAGTNTIPSALKQDVLLMDALSQFKRIIMPLLSFAKNVGAVPLRGTTTIQVPYVPEDTTTSTTWNSSNGYVAGDTAVEARTLTLTRYYKAIRFTADELARQPFLMVSDVFNKASERLAYDVWLGFLAQITAANFATTVTGAATSGVATGWPLAAGGFDSNAVANLRNSANLSQWPFVGRVLIVNSDYDTALMKDNAVKNAMAAGSNAVIQDGVLTKIFGWNYGMNPNWPTNSENLVGIIAQQNALLIGSSPIAPTDAELRAGLLYQLVSDPSLGISLEYKDFGEPQMNREWKIIEANWGAGKGNEKNLYRLTSA